MQNSQNKKALQIGLFVLVAIVVLGVGYAAISAVNLIINGNATASVNQNNFKVHFTQAQAISGSTGVSGTSSIDTQDDTKATFDVTGLTKIGDYAEAVYTVRNDSNGIGAEITLNLESSNTEYFKVTETILDNKLQAGEETTAKVRVEMIKTPVAETVSTSITATLTASPLEDAEATGGEEKSDIKPTLDPYTYLIRGDIQGMYTNIISGIDPSVRTYTSFAAAKADFGHPLAIAVKVESGSVTESYITFEKDGKVYNLKRPIVDEASLEEKPIYDANVAVLKEAFGPDWESVCNDYGSKFFCDADGWKANVDCGRIYAYDGSWSCRAFAGGRVGCSSWE